MSDFNIIWKAVLAGLATGLLAALPLGPAALEAVKRSISRGYKEGFLVSLGAVSTDAFDILLINFGILSILESDRVLESMFWVVSGIALCIMGYISIRKAKRGPVESHNNVLKPGRIKSMPFAAGFIIAFLNPLTHSFWLTISGTVIRAWRLAGDGLYYIFIVFILVGMLAWFTILNLLAYKGQKIIAPNSSEKLSIYIMWGIIVIGAGFIIYGLHRVVSVYVT